MPTYDYECDACQHEFETFQNMSDDPLTKCPKCKKKKLRRLIGAGAAVLFKGSGFSQTDDRSESSKKSAEADKKSSEPAPASESKSDSKPAESKPAAEAKSSAPAKADKKK